MWAVSAFALLVDQGVRFDVISVNIHHEIFLWCPCYKDTTVQMRLCGVCVCVAVSKLMQCVVEWCVQCWTWSTGGMCARQGWCLDPWCWCCCPWLSSPCWVYWPICLWPSSLSPSPSASTRTSWPPCRKPTMDTPSSELLLASIYRVGFPLFSNLLICDCVIVQGQLTQ